MSPWRFTLLGYKLGLARPELLALLGIAAVVGLALLGAALRRRRRVAATVASRSLHTLAPGISGFRPAANGALVTAALGCFALALAQPQCGERAEVVKRRGLDVVVAIDASRSMYARDVLPSRIDRARLELGALLERLKGDRVAIVAFAGDAFVQCPLTGDYAAARIFLRAVDPEQMPQGGTNIGAALVLARDVLAEGARGGRGAPAAGAAAAKDRVVVLLSDGEDLTGDIDEGVAALKELGAKVLAVGIGSEAGERIPVLGRNGELVGYKKDDTGVTVLSRLDRAGLTRIAEETGGSFFVEPRGVAIGEVIRVIDGLQKAEHETRLLMKYGELFQPFVALGLLFLGFAAAVTPSWRPRR